MARQRPTISTWEPVPFATAEHAGTAAPVRTAPAPYRVVRVGRLRVPIAGPYRPWATLYRLPDGRELWCLRLWEHGRAERRVVSTATLLSYARRSGLRQLEEELLDLRGCSP
jgi:hypothetical protein